MKNTFGEQNEAQTKEVTLVPNLEKHQDPYADFVRKYEATPAERFVVMLALCPHLRPDLLETMIYATLQDAGNYPQLGGIKGKQHRGFLPTGETALFLLAGNDLSKRIEVEYLFSEDHWFSKEGILSLENPPSGEPHMSGRLMMNKDQVDLLVRGRVGIPKFSMNFPAERLETKMNWDDLILNNRTFEQLEELSNWLQYQETIMDDWGMQKFFKRGHRSLFYGPPGTGKTLTATLLGQRTNRMVFRVDLSMVVSKYIGETEKNLSNLFTRAANKDWILFFDEADALFSKRTGVQNAHDKHANQEVAFLLQKVEQHNGLVILATNFKSNIDEAFMRRFQAIVHFPAPSESERLRLWNNTLPKQLELAKDVQPRQLARKYKVTGSHISNIVQRLCLISLTEKRPITQADFILLIKQELEKEGKIA